MKPLKQLSSSTFSGHRVTSTRTQSPDGILGARTSMAPGKSLLVRHQSWIQWIMQFEVFWNGKKLPWTKFFLFFSLSMKKSKGWQWGGYHGYKHPSRESRGVPGPYYFNEQMSTLSWQGQLKWPHVLQQKSVHLWWLCLKYFSTFPRLLVCCFAKCMLLLAHWRRTRVWER